MYTGIQERRCSKAQLLEHFSVLCRNVCQICDHCLTTSAWMDAKPDQEEKIMSDVMNVEELFGRNVFDLAKMRSRLPKNVYKEVKHVMDKGGELSMAAAN